MNMQDVGRRGLVILGCGKMGSALLRGWLAGGLAPSSVWVLDPYPSDWLTKLDGVQLNCDLADDPAVVLVAVKPQMIGAALPALAALGNGTTLFLSVAAGTPISAYEAALGARTPIIRAMPNTPAAIGKGITALIGNARADAAAMELAEMLMSAVGQTVRLRNEAQIDAVTAVSGSGPAYVFHLIETLAAAGGRPRGCRSRWRCSWPRRPSPGLQHWPRQRPKTRRNCAWHVTSPRWHNRGGAGGFDG